MNSDEPDQVLIMGYTILVSQCCKCENRADIRIQEFRKYKNSPLRTGQFMSNYCDKHSPINIEQEQKRWRQIASVPPGG